MSAWWASGARTKSYEYSMERPSELSIPKDAHMAATPPTLRSRPSANSLERGGITPQMPHNPSFSDCSDMSSPIGSLPQTPSPQWRQPAASPLSWIFTRSWWSNSVLLLLVLSALISWYPVLRFYWQRQRAAAEHAPYIHVFHEARCVGEFIELRKSSDLCSLFYQSGVSVKDNVASLRLVADEVSASSSSSSASPPAARRRLAVDVFATCRLAELPTDPMRLETSTRARRASHGHTRHGI